jgi:hypothetical protein
MNTVKIEIEGTYHIHDGMITVTAPWGHTKTTQLGGSAAAPEALAKIMLRELVDDLKGYPHRIERVIVDARGDA